jgi:hypothetical protein
MTYSKLNEPIEGARAPRSGGPGSGKNRDSKPGVLDSCA